MIGHDITPFRTVLAAVLLQYFEAMGPDGNIDKAVYCKLNNEVSRVRRAGELAREGQQFQRTRVSVERVRS